jgi:peroxiredoxin
MAQSSNRKLDHGEAFPDMVVRTLEDANRGLYELLGGKWAVLLFYRGHWCRYCRQQLADFQSHLAGLDALNVRVVALSADDEANARRMKDELKLTFPIVHGLDAEAVAKSVGAYYEPQKKFLQATGFILRPERMLHAACYATGPVGRLTATDTIATIAAAQEK